MIRGRTVVVSVETAQRDMGICAGTAKLRGKWRWETGKSMGTRDLSVVKSRERTSPEPGGRDLIPPVDGGKGMNMLDDIPWCICRNVHQSSIQITAPWQLSTKI